MFGGNSDQLEQMMEQMGIDFEEISAERVIIKTNSGQEIEFNDVNVNKLDSNGEEVHMITGEPDSTYGGETKDKNDSNNRDSDTETGFEITDEDIDIVCLRADATEDEAKNALEKHDGDLAKAVEELS